ncbi:MAG: glycine zipper family protein [Cyanobacteria bacterium P01_A01_bin.116]
MSLAYQGYSLDEFPDMGSDQAFRQRLFDTYIERMFRRRGNTYTYTNQQAKHLLVWIAQRMVQASQTVFFIENMQPSWLQNRDQRLLYHLESSLIFGLIGMLSGALVGLLSGGGRVGMAYGALTGGLTPALIAATLGEITPVETLKWSWKATKISLRTGLIYGLIVGLIYALIFVLMVWINGLFWPPDDPDDWINGFIGLPIFALFSGLFGGLIFGLFGGLKGPGIGNKTKPNQGIWRSARNAGILTLVLALFGGMASGLIAMLIFGLFGGLLGGGSACIRHSSLRLMLYRVGYIPWNYARFLDYAAERLFLQKVGGGYIFIHRMLLEHFAQMTLEQKRPQ